MSIADDLKKAMELQGIKPADLVRMSGVPQGRVSQILSGKTPNPRADTLSKLWDAIRSAKVGGFLPAEDGPTYESPYIEKVAALMASMDLETQKDICLSVEKEKLLRDLLRQREADQKAG